VGSPALTERHPVGRGRTILIEPFSDAYGAQVVDLILHIQNAEYGLGITLDEQSDLLYISEAYLGSGGGFWIARDDEGAVVGTIGLQVKPGENGERWGIMKKFFVRLDLRGTASGVSARLYGALLAHAVAMGLRGIVLDTPAAAMRSHAFYRRAGFEEITAADLPVPYGYPDRSSRLFRLVLAP
jgi:N-acetylglutamate synthase-like GNAT family acetyltransferase